MVRDLQHLAERLLSPSPRGQPVQIKGACPPAQALLVSLLLRRTHRPILCVTPDGKDAERMAEEVAFFASLFAHAPDADASGPPPRVIFFPSGLPRPVGLTRASVSAARDRIAALLALLEPRSTVVVTSLEGVRERVIPRDVLAGHTRTLRAGDEADRDELAAFLQGLGYTQAPVVESPGEYAVRGSLVDVHPLCEELPLRIDFFGDVIDQIRSFQPDTQRSGPTLASVTIRPAGLFVARAVERAELARRVKERADQLQILPRHRMDFLARVEAGLPAHELPVYLPFFYPRLETLPDYLGADRLVLLTDPTRIRRGDAAQDEEASGTLDQLARKGTIVPDLRDLYMRAEDLWGDLPPDASAAAFSDLPLGDARGIPGAGEDPDGRDGPLVIRSQGLGYALRGIADGALPRGLSAYVPLIQGWIDERKRVFLVCGSEPEKVRMSHLLREYDLAYVQPEERLPFSGGTPALYLLRGPLSQGFTLSEGEMVFVHEDDIFGRKVRKKRLREAQAPPGQDLKELRTGDFVVHIDFGIGLYRGLETLSIRDSINDYLHLEYDKGDKLYLPVDRASRIQKYVSTEEAPPGLDRLGGTSWARTKQKVRESVLAMAEELVGLYATRLVRKGHAFSPPDASFEEFEASFPYEETPDQIRAIEDVLQDMEGERPMDRLVCGDVGFGKTEVAVRAAYKAVMDGKQVGVLVPTTVLAQQHYRTFRRRFADQPVVTQMLSRFRSPREQKAILADLAEGKVDIVVGTHRLLQKDVIFRDLGLLILDEEHRFGVRQKEALKQIRAEVDVLTLTATPIPRTLQMSLLGLRDLSTIKTPPQDRRAIETYVVPFAPDIIRHAVLREMERGGQVFIVHNQVYDIEPFADRIRSIVPEARIAVAHGQMAERELERIMMEFVEQRHDILISTSIIESGLDIPNANTLLVHRSHRLGLAQLYQLRGRVGRSERQAYAYLIVQDEDTLTDEARKRLEALYEFSELASGFRIARHDLEIRGAGNLLGAAQSGQVRAVGYDLYMEMLEKAIRELKGEEVLEEVDPEIHLDLPAYLPGAYIEDSTQRLSLYKRLANTRDAEALNRLGQEMEDRFGALPPEAKSLLELIRIKVRLRNLRIREARLAEDGLMLTFDPQTPVSVDRILGWAAREPERLRLFPNDRLLVRFAAAGPAERLAAIQRILSALEREGQGAEVANG